jgi:hypothetical protein
VTQIVQERGGKSLGPGFVVESLVDRQLVATGVDSMLKRLHDVCGPDGVRKARMLCAREHQRGEPQLSNPP